jgi:hypothetical protein
MGSFESDLRILETELGVVAKAFGELTDEQWRAPTLLIPLDEKLPHWTVFELAGHFDISIGLTRMLVADNTAGQVGPGPDQLLYFFALRGGAGRLRLCVHDGRGQDARADAWRADGDLH